MVAKQEKDKMVNLPPPNVIDNWVIGDAILNEGGIGKPLSFNEVADELVKQGHKKYSGAHLNNVALTAQRFPKETRRADIPWCVYKEARSPEVLEMIITGAGTTRLTRDIARKFRKEFERKAQKAAITDFPAPSHQKSL
jgi:hypothetical protein